MRIDTAGNVGIGTATPQSQLHLNVPGSESPISAMTVDVQTFGNIANAQASNFFQVRDIGAKPPKGKTHFIINGLGNVGIGTTTPEAGLHIDKANTNDVALKLSSNGPGWGSGIQLKNNDIAYGIYSGFERFHICDVNKQVDRLIIDAAGNVGIGTGSPSAKLEVNGDIKVTGDVILTNADCAEDFDIMCAESVEPGMVMVINDGGALKPSQQAYDRRVAGVISGAGDLRPGITLDRQNERANRLPLALTGKVYCKVDAEYSSIEVGDLLTTSSTIGHAMKVNDHEKAIGAIIGKALKGLSGGKKGLIPILVALQ
jgi:hypothetical protein